MRPRHPAPLMLATRPDIGEAPAPAIPSGLAPVVVTEAEAAEMLRLSPRTLQRLRLDGNGPPFIPLTPSGSRIAYLTDALREWAMARMVMSTSDKAARRGAA